MRLYESGFRPSLFRWAFWIVGFVFGFGSRILGKARILETGIRVDTEAVHHYAELPDTIDRNDETRKAIEEDQAHEHGHVGRWKNTLESGMERQHMEFQTAATAFGLTLFTGLVAGMAMSLHMFQ